jgi:hypothetical protein
MPSKSTPATPNITITMFHTAYSACNLFHNVYISGWRMPPLTPSKPLDESSDIAECYFDSWTERCVYTRPLMDTNLSYAQLREQKSYNEVCSAFCCLFPLILNEKSTLCPISIDCFHYPHSIARVKKCPEICLKTPKTILFLQDFEWAPRSESNYKQSIDVGHGKCNYSAVVA